jgi:hypothetical protein
VEVGARHVDCSGGSRTLPCEDLDELLLSVARGGRDADDLAGAYVECHTPKGGDPNVVVRVVVSDANASA